MKKTLKTIVTLVLALTFLLGVFPMTFASADNYKVSGNTGAAKTFTVKTGKSTAKIVITPEKGIINRVNKFTGRKSTSREYGDYKIMCTDQKTGYTYWTTLYSGKRTLTLQPDTTYKITVRPLNNSLFETLGFFSLWYYTGWKKNATWSVTKTKNVIYCG